ncbi:zinc finger BED domain-containing protein 5-like [Oratosquilla oratoria]|uniref:zinc finger BED domain-containing protein 5-like n=1 Tax=Oratosquilla oratoria TaxID=337810 RepID=UPI003F777703
MSDKKAEKGFIAEFIEVYRSLPALWDVKCKDYTNRAKKGEQYEVLIEKYREKYPDGATKARSSSNDSVFIRTKLRKSFGSITLSSFSNLSKCELKMEKFLKQKSTDELSIATSSRQNEGSSLGTKERKSKLRKYNSSYIAYGFTFVVKNDGVEYPKCVICQEILSNEGMKPSKLQRHLQQKHSTEATKSINFFKRQKSSVASQANTFKQRFTLPDRALKASFLASFHIARGKKKTIGDVVQELFGNDAVNQVDVVPLSNNTVSRRIDDMAEDVTVQLLEQVKNSEYFALQLDESTDVANKAQLLVYIRFISEGKFVEEILFCKAMTGRTTGKDIFRILDEYMEQNSIDWLRCVGVCTDGAAAMTGKRSGVIAFIKERAPNVVSTHCMLHREALVAKRIDDELYQVLQIVVKTVNYVKAHPMKARLFEALCHEMDADFHGLLLHSEVRWLSRGAVSHCGES